ncbi:major facilitator superfamily domain-containing protein [Nemania abortiva]|nr:major facilitator superfamily domain-containing protein [Nemania abortiva]
MASHEGMFRNSVWSRDGGNISLNSFVELERPWDDGGGGDRRMLYALNPVSKFSVSSDDDNENLDYYSPHHTSSPFSNSSRPVERTPLTISPIHTISQQSREHAVPQALSNDARQEKPPRPLQPSSGTQGNSAAPEEPKIPLLREILFVAVVCIAHLCAQAGISQTLPTTRGVGSRFQVANANDLSVAIAGYAAALGTFMLIAGRLGETFGCKRIFIVGLGWSAAWSLIVGTSFYSTRSLFITSRAFQGVGAALTLPTGLELLRARRATGIRRAIIFTLYAIMSPMGLIIGALGASLFDKLAWWSWAYWAFSITLTVLGIISCFIIPPVPRAKGLPSGARAIALELDIPGIITGIASFGLFGFAWCQAQVVGWQEAYLWIILTMSVALAVLFVILEACYAPKPLIPFSSLSAKILWILIAIACSWSCFGIWLFYGWQFVEHFRSTSPLQITTYFVPFGAVGCLSVVTTPFILNRFQLHVVLCIAMLATMIGSVLVATMPIRQSYWQQMFISILFMSWGVNISVPTAELMVLKLVHRRHGGIVATLVWTAMYYGMGLGLGIAGTVESNIGSRRSRVHNRLRGYRAAHWTSFGLAGLGFLVCLALALASRRRKSPT